MRLGVVTLLLIFIAFMVIAFALGIQYFASPDLITLVSLIANSTLAVITFLAAIAQITGVSLRDLSQSEAIKGYIRQRRNFVLHLIWELQRLSRASDWSDFYYTDLEAEVEIDPLEIQVLTNKWLGRFRHYIYLLLLPLQHPRRKKSNLVAAIESDTKSRVFLIIGDPGSGKTVSLWRLFLNLADKAQKSRHRELSRTPIPLYLNLKSLDIPADDISAEAIYDWIIRQMQSVKDRAVNEFLKIHFDSILNQQGFFFIFDSFDEIPAILDAYEEAEIIQKYADALERFIHGPHGCKGVLSSRPYRSPKVFSARKLTIRQLSNDRIKLALNNYLVEEPQICEGITRELLSLRDDLLHLVRNPFYLGLLARFIHENHALPSKQYELFDNFISARMQADIERLDGFEYTPSLLNTACSELAYAMLAASNVGLEAPIERVHEALNTRKIEKKWTWSEVQNLVQILAYTKLGRITDGANDVTLFSFAHRRFHEYFAAVYVGQQLEMIRLEQFAADNRWREVLVLLCEVLPARHLYSLFDLVRFNLETETNSTAGQTRRIIVETLRFLRDGFRSRSHLLPKDIRQATTTYIERQLLSQTNVLQAKRSLECLQIADPSSLPFLLEMSLSSSSEWLKETALRSCYYLPRLPESLQTLIREHIREHFYKHSLRYQLDVYRVIFSAPIFSQTLFPYVNFLARLDQLSFMGLVTCIVMLIAFNPITGVASLMLAGFFWISIKAMLFFTEMEERSRQRRKVDSSLSWVEHPNPLNNPFLNVLRNDRGFFGVIVAIVVVVVPIIGWILSVGLLVLSLTSLIIVPWLHVPCSRTEWHMLGEKLARWRVPDSLKQSILKGLKNTIIFILYLGIMAAVFLAIIILGNLNTSPPVTSSSSNSTLDFTATIFIIGLMISLIASTIIWSSIRIYASMARSLRDVNQIARFLAQPSIRPTSAKETLDTLHLFHDQWAKDALLGFLPNWIPIGPDPEKLAEIAETQTPLLRDRLYQLVERWEDSQFSPPPLRSRHNDL